MSGEHEDPARPARLAPGNPPGRPQNCPFVVRCPPGKYALCQCQLSARFPYCDGSHRDAAATAEGNPMQPRKVLLDVERSVAWCCCGRSANPPFCDGSHARS
ncbi:MAG: CDGSH iron-sulfur domain-containing protein [Planctomycetes bacterium]|nr:CDGSH iron-sulfur domain-containing protein [Planctomycetota bacterium]